MNRGILVVCKGSTYGEYEVLREDFADLLRALRLEVVEDIDIPESNDGANPKAIEDYARKNQMQLVTLLINGVPFYYAVKGNNMEGKIRFWFKEVE